MGCYYLLSLFIGPIIRKEIIRKEIIRKEIIRKEIEDTLQEVLADLKIKSKFFRQELKTSSISHEMVDNYCERKGRH